MNVEKVYKTDVSDIVGSMSELEKTVFIQDIILKVRKNPNHISLGEVIDKYVKDVLGDR